MYPSELLRFLLSIQAATSDNFHTLIVADRVIGLGNLDWATQRLIEDLARVVIALT